MTNTDSKIWKALNAMGSESKTAARDEVVSEALSELAQKDATLKALADALENLVGSASGRIPEPMWSELRSAATNALRLAGRRL